MPYTPKASTGISNLEELRRYVEEELHQIALNQRQPVEFLWLEPHSAPVANAKPRDGMIAFSAAGFLGPNAGVYAYEGGIWKKL